MSDKTNWKIDPKVAAENLDPATFASDATWAGKVPGAKCLTIDFEGVMKRGAAPQPVCATCGKPATQFVRPTTATLRPGTTEYDLSWDGPGEFRCDEHTPADAIPLVIEPLEPSDE
jgi:hypothetical protein